MYDSEKAITKILDEIKEKYNKLIFVFRYQREETTNVIYLEDKLDKIKISKDEGVGIHTFDKEGYMGFASTNIVTGDQLKKTVEASIMNFKMAKNEKFETVKGINFFKPTKKKIISSPYTRRLNSKEIKKKLVTFINRVKKIKRPKDTKYSLIYSFNFTRLYKRILRTDGTDIIYAYPYSLLHISITGQREGETQMLYVVRRGKLLDTFKDENGILVEIKNCFKLLSKLLKAPKIKPGHYNLLLDGEVGGTFIHEAFGHSAESDAIKVKSPLSKNGVFKKYLTVAPKFVNVYEDTRRFDRGYTPYDEYGIRRKKVFIIKNGKLCNFLSDINYFLKSPNGASRAESYADIPLPRMSNTVIEISKEKGFNFNFHPLRNSIEKIYKYLQKEKILDINKPYVYLISCSGGEVLHEEGIFQFNADLAYFLHKGKIKLFKGVSFGGKTLTVLKSILGGSLQKETIPGSCGKNGQNVPVLSTAPAILVLKSSKSIKIG